MLARNSVILSHGGKHCERAGTYLQGAPVGDAAQHMPRDVLAPELPAKASAPAVSINRYPVSNDDDKPQPQVAPRHTHVDAAVGGDRTAVVVQETKAAETKSLVPSSRAELKKLSRADLVKVADGLGIDAGQDVKTETMRELVASMLGVI